MDDRRLAPYTGWSEPVCVPLNAWQHARCLVALATAPVRYGVAPLFTLKTYIDLPDTVPLMPQCHSCH